MAEAHEAERVVLVLGTGDIFRNVVDRTYLFEHFEGGFIRAAMCGAPETGDTRGDTGEGIGAGGAGETHRRGRGVLLVIGVEDEDLVERARQNRIDLVVLARHGEAHTQEVSRCSRVRSSDRRRADRSNICTPIAARVGNFAISRMEATIRCFGSEMLVES